MTFEKYTIYGPRITKKICIEFKSFYKQYSTNDPRITIKIKRKNQENKQNYTRRLFINKNSYFFIFYSQLFIFYELKFIATNNMGANVFLKPPNNTLCIN